MEVYYKDLISEEASLEKLVDDLTRLVQGAPADAPGMGLGRVRQAEITSSLERLKERCRHFQEQACAGAVATDKLLRQNPYSSFGWAFGLGILGGVLLARRRRG
jgi:MYXO-CTERM domain-containing protein